MSLTFLFNLIDLRWILTFWCLLFSERLWFQVFKLSFLWENIHNSLHKHVKCNRLSKYLFSSCRYKLCVYEHHSRMNMTKLLILHFFSSSFHPLPTLNNFIYTSYVDFSKKKYRFWNVNCSSRNMVVFSFLLWHCRFPTISFQRVWRCYSF